jgi:hypothetical protein
MKCSEQLFSMLCRKDLKPRYKDKIRVHLEKFAEVMSKVSGVTFFFEMGGLSPFRFIEFSGVFYMNVYMEFIGACTDMVYRFDSYTMEDMIDDCRQYPMEIIAKDWIIERTNKQRWTQLCRELRAASTTSLDIHDVWKQLIIDIFAQNPVCVYEQFVQLIPSTEFQTVPGTWESFKTEYIKKVLNVYGYVSAKTGLVGNIVLGLLGFAASVTTFIAIFKVVGVMISLFKGLFAEKSESVDHESRSDPKLRQRQINLESRSDPKLRIRHTQLESKLRSTPRSYATKTLLEGASSIQLEGEGKVTVPLRTDIDPRLLASELEVAVQGQIDPNAWDLISCRLIGNIVDISCEDGAHLLRGLMLGGNLMLTYRHDIPKITYDQDEVWELSTFKARPLCKFYPSDMTIKPCSTSEGLIDLVLIRLPRNVPRFANITNHLIDTDNFSQLSGHAAALVCPRVLPNKEGSPLLTVFQIREMFSQIITNDSYPNATKTLSSIGYAAETKVGDCGAILVALNSRFEKKICGMHVAGNSGKGFSVPLSAPRVQRWLDDAEETLNDSPPLQAVDQTLPAITEGAFIPFGHHETRAGQISATGIKPSSISGCIQEPITAPAVLRPVERDGVLVNPLLNGLKKCGGVNPLIPETMLTEVSDDVARVYIGAREPTERKIFTLEEACFGEAGNPSFGPLTLSTSPGFPFCKQKQARTPGKRSWINNETFTISDRLRTIIDECLEKLRRGERIEVYWQDLNKDERRLLEKVLAVKTRVFSASPLHFTILCRMYFGAFVSHQARNVIHSESSIGINPYSIDWHVLATHLRGKGRKVFAGDYSGWDGSVSAQLLWSALDTIEKWYDGTEEEKLIRRTLFMEIASSVHIYDDVVYGQTHCMPSGVYLTATVNTIIGQMLMRLFWLKCAPRELATMEEFNKHVSLIIYGDDNIVNVSDFASSFFNQDSVTRVAPTFGVVYTDEAKTGDEVAPTRDLTEVTFLKRSFKFSSEDARWVGQLDIRVIDEMCNWYHSSDIEAKQLPLVIDSQLREYAMYPEAIYNGRKDKILKACRAAEIRLPAYPTWRQNRHMLLHGLRTNYWA